MLGVRNRPQKGLLSNSPPFISSSLVITTPPHPHEYPGMRPSLSWVEDENTVWERRNLVFEFVCPSVCSTPWGREPWLFWWIMKLLLITPWDDQWESHGPGFRRPCYLLLSLTHCVTAGKFILSGLVSPVKGRSWWPWHAIPLSPNSCLLWRIWGENVWWELFLHSQDEDGSPGSIRRLGTSNWHSEMAGDPGRGAMACPRGWNRCS